MASIDDIVSNLKNAVLNLSLIAQNLNKLFSATTATGANPSATAGPTAVNGSALTFMRSDAAPAVQKASAVQFGIVEVDNVTITASGGVITAVGGGGGPVGGNPTATAGPAAVNGSAVTFLRSDGAPAVQLGTNAQKGIVQVDNTTITASAGVISAVQPAGANPSATAGPNAVNGVATTFMRSDGAPAVQKASAAQFGLVEVDGVTITASGGVISATPAVGLPADIASGRWGFITSGSSISGATGIGSANTIYAHFGWVNQITTVKALGVKSGSGGGGHTVQLAIYSVSGNTLTLVDKTADIANGAGAAISGAVLNTTDVLTPGTLYAFCFNSTNADTFDLFTYGNNFAMTIGGATLTTLIVSTATGLVGTSITQTYGTWPGTITLSGMTDATQVPVIAFQVN